MKAMIFAAGRGTRLQPLTDTLPKALVDIKGKPMLEHLLLKLKDAGFREVVINIHHFGDLIIDFLKARNNFGLDIRISDERDCLLDTGGGLRHAAPFLRGNEPFLVHNVDILSDVDLAAFYRSHREGSSLATLLVSERPASRLLLFDERNQLCGWRNSATGEIRSPFPDCDARGQRAWAFGGIHVVSPAIFDRMEEWSGPFSIIDFYLAACVKDTITACPVAGAALFDAGKYESLETTLRQLTFI